MRNVLSTLKIGFDLDTILAATDEASISWYQERGLVGPEVTAAQITKWDHSECLGVDPEAMFEMFASDSFFRNIPPIQRGRRNCPKAMSPHGAECPHLHGPALPCRDRGVVEDCVEFPTTGWSS
jgi:hypothetical protein